MIGEIDRRYRLEPPIPGTRRVKRSPEMAPAVIVSSLAVFRGPLEHDRPQKGRQLLAIRTVGQHARLVQHDKGIRAIITKPPYTLAREFIERPCILMVFRVVAMLLRTDFDHAATRAFASCPMFAKKVMLTKRIRWFEDSTGSPSFNHCWMIWNRRHQRTPTLAYASGSAEYRRSGLAGTSPPQVLDQGPWSLCPALTQRGKSSSSLCITGAL